MPMSGGKRNHEDVSANSPHNYCTRALRASHSVRCPQPWPRPTSHVPDGDAEQRRRRPLSAPSHPAPATPAPDSFTTLHAAACAVLCGGHQERACPQPLWSWWRANPGSTAAQHIRNGCVLPRAHLTHCPPALLHGAPSLHAGSHVSALSTLSPRSTSPSPPSQPYSLLSCNARRTPQRNVSQIACELLLCRSDGGTD